MLEHEHGKVRMNFWLTKQMYDYVEARAVEDGRSMSDVLRQALREFMDKHPVQGEKNNVGDNTGEK